MFATRSDANREANMFQNVSQTAMPVMQMKDSTSAQNATHSIISVTISVLSALPTVWSVNMMLVSWCVVNVKIHMLSLMENARVSCVCICFNIQCCKCVNVNRYKGLTLAFYV